MCRFRPMNTREKELNTRNIMTFDNNNTSVSIEHPDKKHHPKPLEFTFDYIFSPKTTQVEVFEFGAGRLVDNMFDGYNATIFACMCYSYIN